MRRIKREYKDEPEDVKIPPSIKNEYNDGPQDVKWLRKTSH